MYNNNTHKQVQKFKNKTKLQININLYSYKTIIQTLILIHAPIRKNESIITFIIIHI